MIDLIGWMKKNNRAARAARFLVQMFWRSLPNDDVKFSYLRFWQQSEVAAVNLSPFAFTWKPFVPNKRKRSSAQYFVPRDQHGTESQNT